MHFCWQKRKIRCNLNMQRWKMDAQRLTAVSIPSWISRSIVVSFPSHFWCCTSLPFSKLMTVWQRHLSLSQLNMEKIINCASLFYQDWPTLVFRPSAVVSSNSSFSLNLISAVFKVLSAFRDIKPSSVMLNTRLGFTKLPICLVAKFTPETQK